MLHVADKEEAGDSSGWVNWVKGGNMNDTNVAQLTPEEGEQLRKMFALPAFLHGWSVDLDEVPSPRADGESVKGRHCPFFMGFQVKYARAVYH